jgi:hypothetical protein
MQLNDLLITLPVGLVLKDKYIKVFCACIPIIDPNIELDLVIGLPMLAVSVLCNEVQCQVVHHIHKRIIDEDTHRLLISRSYHQTYYDEGHNYWPL